MSSIASTSVALPDQALASTPATGPARSDTRLHHHLEPLTLGQPGFIYLQQDRACVQYSFRAAGHTSEQQKKAAEHYETVKKEVTVLVSALCHSRALLQGLGATLRLSSPDGYYVECTCVHGGKASQTWRWTKDGENVDATNLKLRFEFGIA